MLKGNPILAFDYLTQGARMLMLPGLRRFVIMPLLVNLVVFVVITGVLINNYGNILHDAAIESDWLRFFAWLLWIIIGLVLLVVYGYTFNLLTTLIAAPFYGVLAEKIEVQLTGNELPSEPLNELILRTFQRELVKLWYFISRGILVLLLLIILFFIPLAGSLASLIISTVWAAWCMAVQYTDYAADNNRVAFKQVRRKLNQQSLTSYSMGGFILLGSMLPIINIFVMPIAVAGATLYWTQETRSNTTSPSLSENH